MLWVDSEPLATSPAKWLVSGDTLHVISHRLEALENLCCNESFTGQAYAISYVQNRDSVSGAWQNSAPLEAAIDAVARLNGGIWFDRMAGPKGFKGTDWTHSGLEPYQTSRVLVAVNTGRDIQKEAIGVYERWNTKNTKFSFPMAPPPGFTWNVSELFALFGLRDMHRCGMICLPPVFDYTISGPAGLRWLTTPEEEEEIFKLDAHLRSLEGSFIYDTLLVDVVGLMRAWPVAEREAGKQGAGTFVINEALPHVARLQRTLLAMSLYLPFATKSAGTAVAATMVCSMYISFQKMTSLSGETCDFGRACLPGEVLKKCNIPITVLVDVHLQRFWSADIYDEGDKAALSLGLAPKLVSSYILAHDFEGAWQVFSESAPNWLGVPYPPVATPTWINWKIAYGDCSPYFPRFPMLTNSILNAWLSRRNPATRVVAKCLGRRTWALTPLRSDSTWSRCTAEIGA